MLKLRTRTVLLLLVAAVAPALVAPTLAAQPKPATAKPDPEVKSKLDEFKKLIIDRKGAKDEEAIKIIDSLLPDFDKLHPKDKRLFAKTLYEPLKSTRVKRDPMNSRLFQAAIVALGKTGKEGSIWLSKAFKDKKRFGKKPWRSLRARMLKSLGKTKDQRYIKFLTDEARRNTEDTLMAAAGAALGEFADADLKVRKGIAKDLIKKFSNIHDNANANLDSGDLQRQTWEDRYKAVADPWNTSLQKLTKQSLRHPDKWLKFYNKNKSKNWDKLKTKR